MEKFQTSEKNQLSLRFKGFLAYSYSIAGDYP
jgi:hypothetical protein